jgi:hypothetical protein
MVSHIDTFVIGAVKILDLNLNLVQKCMLLYSLLKGQSETSVISEFGFSEIAKVTSSIS